MKDHGIRSTPLFIICLVVLTICPLFGYSKPPTNPSQLLPPTRIQLSTPARVAAESLSPGLAVIYLDKFYRKIEQMPEVSRAKAMGKQGRPILQLNHKAGKEGLVFDSGKNRGVGMILTGYLHLSTTGEYRFQALSNDGIECTLDGKRIFEDPDVHKDMLSPVGIAEVSTAGWYPFLIRYFQRKGTSALKLYWQPPGATEFSIIPQEIFTHSNS